MKILEHTLVLILSVFITTSIVSPFYKDFSNSEIKLYNSYLYDQKNKTNTYTEEETILIKDNIENFKVEVRKDNQLKNYFYRSILITLLLMIIFSIWSYRNEKRRI